MREKLSLLVISLGIIFSLLGCSLQQQPMVLENETFQYQDYSPQVNLDDVYMSMNPSSDFGVNVSNREELYDDSELVVVGHVVEKHSPEMYLGLGVTPGVIKVSQVLKGDLSSDEYTFFVPGGMVPLENYYNYQSNNYPELVEKQGLSEMSVSQRQNKFVDFSYDFANDFEVGQSYVFIIYNKAEGVVLNYTGMIPVLENAKIDNKIDVLSLPEVLKQ